MSGQVILQITGYKNSGKTTLISSLIPWLKQRGHRVAVIKHDGHDFQMDHTGTDTSCFIESGAEAALISSPFRMAVLRQRPMELEELIGEVDDCIDWIVVEGFKQECYPKLVLLSGFQDVSLVGGLSHILAVVVHPDMAKEPQRLQALQQEAEATVPWFSREDRNHIFEHLYSQLSIR
ncbi:molybdopterin-guanine dinucleotide biosynthesis protein B [Paenibacillus algicola]|uniref:Molybdopterin-guanine dinucleotide biosynthesis protein B n=1 Tax=Paenibacillus algicola TaxID=2565926 RepID=A0A4P8XQT8_9BACL|nr:molybdopterin-guanine dinucleotide biosynthesis protein B [Paenibacillus algicola]QCT02819.1 molybdopterin-guanine dinucleotide biosynthesis protein B [Paenibacillus algicola]